MRNVDYKKQYHGKRNNGRHNSKNFVFRNECSGCGKVLRRNARNRIGFICKKCGPSSQKPKVESQNICNDCNYFDECNARVALGLWLRCETPDIADLERLYILVGTENNIIRNEIDMALDGHGNRLILETEISKYVMKIYLDNIDCSSLRRIREYESMEMSA